MDIIEQELEGTEEQQEPEERHEPVTQPPQRTPPASAAYASPSPTKMPSFPSLGLSLGDPSAATDVMPRAPIAEAAEDYADEFEEEEEPAPAAAAPAACRASSEISSLNSSFESLTAQIC